MDDSRPRASQDVVISRPGLDGTGPDIQVRYDGLICKCGTADSDNPSAEAPSRVTSCSFEDTAFVSQGFEACHKVSGRHYTGSLETRDISSR